MQAWPLRKFDFLRSFSLEIRCFTKVSNFFGEVRTNLKRFSCSTCDKNWKHLVKLCYQQISNLLQPAYELCFSPCNYSFANKINILHEEQKNSNLNLQHRISKKNSFSRYLEVPKRVNVTIFVWCYSCSPPEVFCKKDVLRTSANKYSGHYSG